MSQSGEPFSGERAPDGDRDSERPGGSGCTKAVVGFVHTRGVPRGVRPAGGGDMGPKGRLNKGSPGGSFIDRDMLAEDGGDPEGLHSGIDFSD